MTIGIAHPIVKDEKEQKPELGSGFVGGGLKRETLMAMHAPETHKVANAAKQPFNRGEVSERSFNKHRSRRSRARG